MSIAAPELRIDDRVKGFIASPHKLLIGGQWVEAASGKTFPTFNPATGEVLAQVAEGDKADIDRAVQAARTAFDQGPWRRITTSERGKLIWKLADLLEAHLEEFAQLETLDNGKPLTVARVADVPLAIDLFRYMAGWTTKLEGNTIPISVPFTPGRSIPCVHPTRTRWCGGADHTLEFPTSHGCLETRPCTRCRVHHRAQASRANTSFGHSSRRTYL